jgi:hypothetical protein
MHAIPSQFMLGSEQHLEVLPFNHTSITLQQLTAVAIYPCKPYVIPTRTSTQGQQDHTSVQHAR